MSPVIPAGRPTTPRVVAALLALASVGAACGTGGLPAPDPSAGPTGILPSASGIASAGAVASPTPGGPTPVPATPTPVGALQEPPAAALAGLPGGPGTGTLGSYTWDGSGTDAPWIVPRTGSGTTPGARLDVAFEPEASAESWTARWAPVSGSGAGDVASGVDGTGPVSVTAPAEAGTWSLQLEASFGQGRNAAWYWRLEVGP